MRGTLETIQQLLRRYGHTYEANLAEIARAGFGRDATVTCRALNSDEWWQSTHSVAAVDLAIDGGFSATARRDSQALRRALIEVFTTMLAYNEHSDSAEIMVSQFRKWLELRI